MTDAATIADPDAIVATVHRLHLSLAAKCREQVGVTDEAVAMAAAYAALEAATAHADGDKANGIAWLRAVLDLIEAGQPLTVETIR